MTVDARTAHGRKLTRPASTWLLLAVIGLLAAGLFAAGALQLTHGEGGVVAAALRFVRYVGTLVAVGGFVFLAAVRSAGTPPQRRGRQITLLAAVTAAVVTVLGIPAQSAYLAGDLGAAWDGDTLAAVMGAGFGRSSMVGLVGLLFIALAVARIPASALHGLGAAGAVLAVGAFLLTGHTTTSQPRLLVLAANFVHTSAGAVWLGGLVLLPLALRDRRVADDLAGGAHVVSRFSAVATGALVAVAAAGLALAWVEVRTVAALATPYGAVLLFKVALVAGVAALGAYNNRRLVPAIRGGDTGWDGLIRVVRLEAAGLIGVLAITAVLVNIAPARIEAGIDAQEIRIAELGADRVVTVVVEPARPGTNEIHLYLEGGAGALAEPLDQVTVNLVPPGKPTAATTIAPQAVGPGHYLHLGSEMTRAGDWTMRIVAVDDGREHTAELSVPVTGMDEWDGF